MSDRVLEINGLKHVLRDKQNEQCFTVNVQVPLNFYSGDFIGLLGPSGCGKTTLLSILGLLRKPTNVETLEKFELHVPGLSGTDRTRIDLVDAWRANALQDIESVRRRHMGFALQSGELIKSLTVTENIEVPMLLNGFGGKERAARVAELLSQFSLTRQRDMREQGKISVENNSLAKSRINRLSGGEYQRVALARAIAHRPSVVFVDEPTSALNRELANAALETMRLLQRESVSPGITFMITHDEELATRFCNVVVRMAPRKGEPEGDVIDVSRLDSKQQSVDSQSIVEAVGE
jgi:putative ABC transport system ATP-binding protein